MLEGPPLSASLFRHIALVLASSTHHIAENTAQGRTKALAACQDRRKRFARPGLGHDRGAEIGGAVQQIKRLSGRTVFQTN